MLTLKIIILIILICILIMSLIYICKNVFKHNKQEGSYVSVKTLSDFLDGRITIKNISIFINNNRYDKTKNNILYLFKYNKYSDYINNNFKDFKNKLLQLIHATYKTHFGICYIADAKNLKDSKKNITEDEILNNITSILNNITFDDYKNVINDKKTNFICLETVVKQDITSKKKGTSSINKKSYQVISLYNCLYNYINFKYLNGKFTLIDVYNNIYRNIPHSHVDLKNNQLYIPEDLYVNYFRLTFEYKLKSDIYNETINNNLNAFRECTYPMSDNEIKCLHTNYEKYKDMSNIKQIVTSDLHGKVIDLISFGIQSHYIKYFKYNNGYYIYNINKNIDELPQIIYLGDIHNHKLLIEERDEILTYGIIEMANIFNCYEQIAGKNDNEYHSEFEKVVYLRGNHCRTHIDRLFMSLTNNSNVSDDTLTIINKTIEKILINNYINKEQLTKYNEHLTKIEKLKNENKEYNDKINEINNNENFCNIKKEVDKLNESIDNVEQNLPRIEELKNSMKKYKDEIERYKSSISRNEKRIMLIDKLIQSEYYLSVFKKQSNLKVFIDDLINSDPKGFNMIKYQTSYSDDIRKYADQQIKNICYEIINSIKENKNKNMDLLYWLYADYNYIANNNYYRTILTLAKDYYKIKPSNITYYFSHENLLEQYITGNRMFSEVKTKLKNNKNIVNANLMWCSLLKIICVSRIEDNTVFDLNDIASTIKYDGKTDFLLLYIQQIFKLSQNMFKNNKYLNIHGHIGSLYAHKLSNIRLDLEKVFNEIIKNKDISIKYTPYNHVVFSGETALTESILIDGVNKMFNYKGYNYLPLSMDASYVITNYDKINMADINRIIGVLGILTINNDENVDFDMAYRYIHSN